MILSKNNIVNFQAKVTFFPACLVVILVGLVSGCSSVIDAHKQKRPYMKLYYSGAIKKAAQNLLDESEDYRGTGDELAWRLDEGTALFTAGDYKKSLTAFSRSESLIKDFNQRAIVNARELGAEPGMAVTNLNALPYRGMCVDRIMLNAYKALDYFALNDTSGALVELRRMRYTQKNIAKKFEAEIAAKQREIDEQNRQNSQQSRSIGRGNSSVTFDSLLTNAQIKKVYDESKLKSNKLYGNFVNPFATYFSAIGYLLDHNYGEALVDLRNLYEMDKQNPLLQRDFVTVARTVGGQLPNELRQVVPFNYPLHKKIVFVLFFNGRAPALKQQKFQIILPFVGYTGIAYPQYQYFQPPFSGIKLRCVVDNEIKTFRTVKIASFDAIMSQEYHQRMPSMITRLVISTLTKEVASAVAVYAARAGGGTGGMLGAMAITGVYKYLFNTADTRCWETLPGEVQVAHFPMPPDGKFSLVLLNAVKAPDSTTLVQQQDNVRALGVKPDQEPAVSPKVKTDHNNDKLGKVNPNNKLKRFILQKKAEIVLQKDDDVTIIYIRALSRKTVIYKIMNVRR